jgi:hypothetical protein
MWYPPWQADHRDVTFGVEGGVSPNDREGWRSLSAPASWSESSCYLDVVDDRGWGRIKSVLRVDEDHTRPFIFTSLVQGTGDAISKRPGNAPVTPCLAPAPLSPRPTAGSNAILLALPFRSSAWEMGHFPEKYDQELAKSCKRETSSS